MQGCVHGWESMGRLLRPGMWAKITHIELRIEHRAPRLLPARCDADAWPCLDFQALGRRRGHDDPCVDGGSAMYGIRIVCRALQESTRPNRHPRYGKPAPENGTYLLQCGVRRTWAVDFAGRGEFTAPTSRDPLAKSPSAPSAVARRDQACTLRSDLSRGLGGRRVGPPTAPSPTFTASKSDLGGLGGRAKSDLSPSCC